MTNRCWSFFIWAGHIVQGDLGQSIFLHIPVTTAIAQRLEPTLLLAAAGMFFGVLIGIPLGMLSAIHHRTVVDKLCISVSLLGISIPSFFIAIVLILVFGVYFDWLPVAGYQPISEAGIGVVRYLILPGISLGLMQSGLIARMTRSAMLDVLNQNYIRTARSKGLLPMQINFIHALKNAMTPIITVIGFSLAALIGGTWIIETIFNIPGIGALAISAILRRDYPVIQGMSALFCSGLSAGQSFGGYFICVGQSHYSLSVKGEAHCENRSTLAQTESQLYRAGCTSYHYFSGSGCARLSIVMVLWP